MIIDNDDKWENKTSKIILTNIRWVVFPVIESGGIITYEQLQGYALSDEECEVHGFPKTAAVKINGDWTDVKEHLLEEYALDNPSWMAKWENKTMSITRFDIVNPKDPEISMAIFKKFYPHLKLPAGVIPSIDNDSLCGNEFSGEYRMFELDFRLTAHPNKTGKTWESNHNPSILPANIDPSLMGNEDGSFTVVLTDWIESLYDYFMNAKIVPCVNIFVTTGVWHVPLILKSMLDHYNAVEWTESSPIFHFYYYNTKDEEWEAVPLWG